MKPPFNTSTDVCWKLFSKQHHTLSFIDLLCFPLFKANQKMKIQYIYGSKVIIMNIPDCLLCMKMLVKQYRAAADRQQECLKWKLQKKNNQLSRTGRRGSLKTQHMQPLPSCSYIMSRGNNINANVPFTNGYTVCITVGYFIWTSILVVTASPPPQVKVSPMNLRHFQTEPSNPLLQHQDEIIHQSQ